MVKKLIRDHALLAAQIAANSLTGFLFMRLLADLFGVSAEKDSFDIAYSVPFIIMNVSGFAFLHGVVTSRFAKMRADSYERTSKVFSTTLAVMTALGALLTLACALSAPRIAALLAPGLSEPDLERTTRLLLLMLPLVFSLGISTLCSAVLVAWEVPVAMECAQTVSRLGVLGASILMTHRPVALESIAWLLTGFSVVAMVVELLILFRTTPMRPALAVDLRDPEFVLICRQAAGLVVAALLAQVSMSYMRRLATLQGPGTLSALTYAMTVVTPLSLIVGKPLSLVLGPRFAGARSPGLLAAVVVGTLAVGSAAAVALSLLGGPLVSLLYETGRFDAASAEATASLLTPLAWSLPTATLLWIVLIPLLAHERTHAAAASYILGYLSHIAFSAFLAPSFGAEGLAWAYTLSVGTQAGFSLLLMAPTIKRGIACSA